MGRSRSAEDVAARRGRRVALSALVFAIYSVQVCRVVADHQVVNANSHGPSNGLITVLLWALWAISLLVLVFFTPGLLGWGPAERAVLNDELVKHYRGVAARVALLVLSLAVLAQVVGLWWWSVPVWWPVAALSLALLAGGVVFAALDARADG